MKMASVNGVGFKGINSDVAPWELDPEYITLGRNFRIQANRLISAGSNEDWDTPSVASNAGLVVPVVTNAGSFWLTLGRSATTDGVQVFNGTSWTDISSASGAYSGIGVDGELDWTACMLGSIPIINNPQHFPEYWSPQQTTQVLQALLFDATNTWQAKGYSCNVIRSHKNFLFALGLTEGATELPHSYRWSHPADNNGLPFTWDEDDLSGLAGKAQLGGDSGALIDGLSLRDSFCMYSESGVNILDYTGDEFVWRRRELSSAFGVLTRNVIAEIKGTHFFLADGDIVRNDGNRLDSIIHNRIRKRLTSQMSADYYDRSYVVRDTALKELWFCVPEDGAQYPNTAYVYNWRDDSWSIHSIPYTEDPATGAVTFGISNAGYGQQAEPPTTYDVLIGVNDTYALTTLTYGSQKRTPLNNTVIGVDQVGNGLIVLDPTNPALVEDTDFFIERTDIVLEGQDNVTMVTRLYPYMDGADPVQIQIGSQEFSGGTVTWGTWLDFDPSTDRKLDVRSTGKLHGYRVRSVGAGQVAMTGMGVEYELAGKR